MRWHSQVLHVISKDLRLLRWEILIYAGVIAVAFAHAAGWFAAVPLRFEAALPYLVIVAAMPIIAGLIQADSPARMDADWATRPLAPSAILVAKAIVAIGVVLAFPLAVQWYALTLLRTPGATALEMLSGSARFCGLLVLWAAVVASLTRSLRNFLIFGFGVPILLLALFSYSMQSAALFGMGTTMRGVATAHVGVYQWVLILGAVFLLAHQYHTRAVKRGVLIAAGGYLAVIVLASWFPGELSLRRLEAAAPARTAPVGDVAIREVYPAERGRRLEVWLDASFPSDGMRRDLVVTRVLLRAPSGNTVVSGRPLPRIVLGGDDTSGVSLSSDSGGPGGTMLRAPLRAEEFSILSQRGVQLELEGRIEVMRRVDFASLELEAGQSAAWNGARTHVVGFARDAHGPHIQIRTTSVDLPYGGLSRPVFAYALQPGGNQRPLTLEVRGSRARHLPFLLPGAPVLEQMQTLYVHASDRPVALALSDPDLNASRLQVWDWHPIGSYPVTVAAPIANR